MKEVKMKNYLYLIFITFLFYVNANEMNWGSISDSEFKTILQNLNINNTADYIQFLRNEGKDLGFPSLKEIPLIYPNKWKSFDDFFGVTQDNTQNSTRISSKNHEVSFMKYKAFILLMEVEGISDDNNYQLWYEDHRYIFNVPQFPDEVYPEFTSWKVLQEPQSKTKPTKPVQKTISRNNLNKLKKRPSYQELKQQVQIRNFNSSIEYQRKYKEIPNAPSHPEQTYGEEWEGWDTFLGKIFLPYQELKQQVQIRNFNSAREYQRRYKEIPKAPSHPERTYGEEWEDWDTFLGQIVLPYQELKQQVQIRNFNDTREYQKRYKEIPKAPSNPDKIYGEELEDWNAFLGNKPPPYQELKQQIQIRNLNSSREYQRRYREIPNAPSHPERIYGEEWEGWDIFLGKSPQKQQAPLPHKELEHNKTCTQQLSVLSS